MADEAMPGIQVRRAERRGPMSLQNHKQQAVKKLQQYVTYDSEMLMRSLVEQLVSIPSQTKVLRRTTDVFEEVLFEIDIDDVHYVLARSQPEPTIEQVNLSPRELVHVGGNPCRVQSTNGRPV